MNGEATYKIPFTQFELPNGKRVPVQHETHRSDVFDKAGLISKEGFTFEIEILTTGHVHATISDADGDYANIVFANINAAHTEGRIGDMILNFDIERAKKLREALRDGPEDSSA